MRTVQQIDEEIVLVLDDLNKLKGQLDSAKGQVVARGKYAPTHWFMDTKDKVRRLGQRHQELTKERSLAARQEKEEKKKRWRAEIDETKQVFRARFFDVARKILDDPLFHKLCAMTEVELNYEVVEDMQNKLVKKEPY